MEVQPCTQMTMCHNCLHIYDVGQSYCYPFKEFTVLCSKKVKIHNYEVFLHNFLHEF